MEAPAPRDGARDVEGGRPLHDRHHEQHDAAAHGHDDALMLDWRGQVAEASGANIFFVFAGALHTPVADCFLDGITRRTVISSRASAGSAWSSG